MKYPLTFEEIQSIVNGEYDIIFSPQFEALYEYYLPEMPYGIAKARSGDPADWLYDKVEEEYSNMKKHNLPGWFKFKGKKVFAYNAELSDKPDVGLSQGFVHYGYSEKGTDRIGFSGINFFKEHSEPYNEQRD